MLDLTSELGELAKEGLKATHYGKQAFTCTPAFRDEFGDVFFALLALANEAGIDAEAALHASLKKYAARLSAAGTVSS